MGSKVLFYAVKAYPYAYNEVLTNRVRELIAETHNVEEKEMFRGIGRKYKGYVICERRQAANKNGTAILDCSCTCFQPQSKSI